MNLPRTALYFCTTALLLAGCKREDDVASYSTPKPPPTLATAQPVAADDTGAAAPQAPEMNYVPPADWTAVRPHDFELARFATSGEGGSTFATVSRMGPQFDPVLNVNRWQGQVGMPPTAPDAISGLFKPTLIGGQDAKTVDLKGSEKRAVITFVERPTETLIYKLLGPAGTVDATLPAYKSFLASVTFDGAPRTPPPAPTQTPPPTASAGSLPVTFSAPPEWTADPKPRMMRVATWTAGGAEIFVTEPITAAAFDLPSNLDRWRKQIGLPPIAGPQDVKSTEVKIGDLTGTLVDVSGGPENKRLIVAYAGKDAFWFFKMQGPADAVAAQKPAFDKFLASVKFKPSGS